MELGIGKEKMETCFRDEQNRAASLIEDKDGTINQFESLISQLEMLLLEMRVKEKLYKENMDLLSSKNDFDNRLEIAQKEIKNLEESELIYSWLTYERHGLQLVNHELSLKVVQLQKEHAEESRLADEKILKFESEKETLVSRQTILETLVAKLETLVAILKDSAKTSSEITKLSNKKMQDLLLKMYEVEKQEIVNIEKEKADRAILDLQRRLQEEKVLLITQIKQDYDDKEMDLMYQHEVERNRLQHELIKAMDELIKAKEYMLHALSGSRMQGRRHL